MDKSNETFTYTYSPKQHDEVQRIRRKYLPQEESKIDQLRRLDASATRLGTLVSVLVGIASTLLFGLGMSCCLVWADTMFVPGIFIGLSGMAGMALAHPIYKYITKRQRKKLAPQILTLTDELLQQ